MFYCYLCFPCNHYPFCPPRPPCLQCLTCLSCPFCLFSTLLAPAVLLAPLALLIFFCFQVRCMSPPCFSSSSDQSSLEKRSISSNKDYHFTCLTKIAITLQTFEKDNTSSATATSRTFASEAVPSRCKTLIGLIKNIAKGTTDPRVELILPK